MREKAYIRDPNGARGGPGKFGTCEQDLEDFEQESLIAQWLESEGKSGAVELKHISRKGTARNTLLKASVSLDQPVGEGEGRTFADLIAGSDGRDLECGVDPDELTHGSEIEIDCVVDVLSVADKIIDLVKCPRAREEVRWIYNAFIAEVIA